MCDSATASMTATSRQAVVKRHPFRGILWGFMMGIGLTVGLIVTKVIELDLTMMILVTVISISVGVLWSTLGPAKAPKGPPPASVTVSGGAPPASRFDDFDDPEKASGPIATAETATDADGDQTSEPATDDD